MKSSVWFFLFWSLLVLVVMINYPLKKLIVKSKEEIIKEKSRILVMNPSHMIVEKGDTFNVKVQIGFFEPLRDETQLYINGKTIMTDKNGIAEYEEKARIEGIRRVTARDGQQPLGSITGERINAFSSVEYLVIKKSLTEN